MKNGRAEMASTTDFEAKCEILADVWMEYRDDEAFVELMDFADLGFPFAYALANGMIENNEIVSNLVDGTFTLLLQLLNVEDKGYTSITELFDEAEASNGTE